MRSVELILAVVLSVIIVSDVRYPNSFNQVLKSPIGLILVLGAILYLFTKSSVLGILAVVAGFTMVQRAGSFTEKYSAYKSKQVMFDNDPPMANAVTLEETVVNNIVSVVNSPGKASYTNSFSDVKNAANAYS